MKTLVTLTTLLCAVAVAYALFDCSEPQARATQTIEFNYIIPALVVPVNATPAQVRALLVNVSRADLRAELLEYGLWEALELGDYNANLNRMTYIILDIDGLQSRDEHKGIHHSHPDGLVCEYIGRLGDRNVFTYCMETE